MDLPEGSELPDEACVIFHVSGGKKHPKTGGPCERIDLDALKCDEDGISVTWVEYFDGDPEERFAAAADALCACITVRKSGVIAKITVGQIKEALADEAVQVRVIRAQEYENQAHCLIEGIAPDNEGVLAVLADAVKDFTPVTDVPGLIND
jgi:hypothetical protein